MTKYYGFSDLENVRQRFTEYKYDEDRIIAEPLKKFPTEVRLLLAIYVTASYEGSAIVVFRSLTGQLYEVNASHCSCHGLEGQWRPELTSFEALKMRRPYWADPENEYSYEKEAGELWDQFLSAHHPTVS